MTQLNQPYSCCARCGKPAQWRIAILILTKSPQPGADLPPAYVCGTCADEFRAWAKMGAMPDLEDYPIMEGGRGTEPSEPTTKGGKSPERLTPAGRQIVNALKRTVMQMRRERLGKQDGTRVAEAASPKE